MSPTRREFRSHEKAYGEERDQLYDRLEGNRGDHAFMLLAGIDVARPEQDREDGHDEGHVERGVLDEDVAEAPGITMSG